MPLLTPELIARLPELYSQEDDHDPIVHVMLHGANGWMWALTEYSDPAPDGYPKLAFGKVYGDFPEFGYVSMGEIDELNANCLEGHGLVWVDTSFTPRPLSQVETESDTTQDGLRRMLENGDHPVITA